jgi:Apea-like HEPN
MSDYRIYDQALELSKKIHECLHNEIEAGRFSTNVTHYVKFGTEFNYTSGIGVTQTSYFDKQGIVLERLSELTNSFEHLPAYKNLLSEMVQSSVSKEDPAELLRDNFIPRILPVIYNDIENKTPSTENVERVVNTLIGDLFGNPLHWDISVWIKGLRIKDDIGNKNVELGRGLSLRRPNPDDFAYEFPVFLQPHYAPNFDDILSNVPDAVLEWHIETNARQNNGYSEVKNRIEKLLVCLSLFKLGSIYAIKTEIHPESFTQKTGIPRLAPFRRVTPYVYEIGLNDISQLKMFIDQTEKWVSARARRNTNSTAEIAIERYRDALLAIESVIHIEHSIASAVMALEALHLSGDDELSHRLSERVSTVLRHFGFDAQAVYTVVKCAYNIRSSFVHGNLLSEKKKINFKAGCGSAQKIADNVLEYVRILILAYLAVTHSTQLAKEGYINHIDDAIIDARCDAEISNASLRVSAITPIR